MFDEWGTKIMFGMRWLKKIDQDWSGTWLMYDFQLGTGQDLEQVETSSQIGLILFVYSVCGDGETVWSQAGWPDEDGWM